MSEHQTHIGTGGFFHPRIYRRESKKTLKCLAEGKIQRIAQSEWSFADEFFTFLVQQNFFKYSEMHYPNPRKKNEVPIWYLLAAQLLLRINGSTRYSNLGMLLRSGSVLTRVGFNIESCSIGFNKKNKAPRKTPVHHDTVRKYFSDTDPQRLQAWHLKMQGWFASQKTFQTSGTFILDQTKIVVTNNPNYTGAEWLPVDEYGHFHNKENGPVHPCYSLSILLHINPATHTVHIAHYTLDGGKTDELEQVSIVESFASQHPGVIKELIVDRGYLSGGMITKLKNKFDIDVLIPLKSSMAAFKEAVAIAEMDQDLQTSQVYENLKPKTSKRKHGVTRNSKVITGTIIDGIQEWETCDVPMTYTLFQNVSHYSDKSSDKHSWVIASTKPYTNPAEVYQRYAQRWSIEEQNRQQKMSWKIDQFTSPERSLIEAQLAFTFLTYSLCQLYLRSEDLYSLTQKLRETWQHEELLGRNAVIVYTNSGFEVLDLTDFTTHILEVSPEAKERLLALMKKQKQEGNG